MKKIKSNNRNNVGNIRKAIRKQKRQQKKIHRQEHYMKKKTETTNIQEKGKYTPGRFVKRPADTPYVGVEVKKKKPSPQSLHDILNKERIKEKTAANRLKSQMEEQRRKILLQANDEEDKVIKKLEKQLGLNKSKNKNNYFTDDGLDYLLEICDRSTTEQIVAAEKHLAEVEGDSDFEEDLAAVTGKNTKDKKEKNILRDNSGDEVQSEDDDEIDNGSDDEDTSEGEEFDDLSGDEDEGDVFGDDSESDAPEEKPTKSQKSTDKKAAMKNSEKLLSKEELNPHSNKEKKKERIISEDDLSKVFSDDEISELSGDESESDDVPGDDIGDTEDVGKDNENEEKKSEVKPDVWEDIYGRKRDKEGNIIKEEKGIYIPPHLRDKDSTTDIQLVQLRRQIKSVLNKLAAQNLHWACSSIEQLYSSNSRHAVNSSLSRQWLEAAVQLSAAPDRLVAEHAALLAVLHANVGSEIGAHFLQELTKRFDAMVQTPQPVHDKRLDNLVSCLAHLYSFKMYQAGLLYDILGRLMEEVSEKHIDCVLVALRCVGGVLRREDPLALRAFIHSAQAALARIEGAAASGSRIKFLLEVLMAVKNNNLMKIPNYDPSHTEHLTKMIRGVIRKGNYVTPLNIRLDDLLKAEERGKWWVVGSAWEGSRVREEKPVTPTPALDQKLLELARKQRMNTDVRRTIFCVIMAAQDYMDAFEKLQHLGLRGQQEREVVHVLLACCLQENTYNPYYAVLGQKLCDYDRKYQLSIQFSVWDKIKDIENLSKQAVTNLAQFLIHLIMEKGLALSVLKVIQFSELNKHTVKFMRQILLAIIMNADLQVALQAFHRVSKPPKLHMFRESLRLFIQHFLIKNAGKKSSILSEQDMATLKQRALEVDKILTLHESNLKF